MNNSNTNINKQNPNNTNNITLQAGQKITFADNRQRKRPASNTKTNSTSNKF